MQFLQKHTDKFAEDAASDSRRAILVAQLKTQRTIMFWGVIICLVWLVFLTPANPRPQSGLGVIPLGYFLIMMCHAENNLRLLRVVELLKERNKSP